MERRDFLKNAGIVVAVGTMVPINVLPQILKPIHPALPPSAHPFTEAAIRRLAAWYREEAKLWEGKAGGRSARMFNRFGDDWDQVVDETDWDQVAKDIKLIAEMEQNEATRLS